MRVDRPSISAATGSRYDPDERAARMAEFPLAAAAGAELFQDFSTGFEESLRLLVAGIEARYGTS
ncbi:TetR/AcrR family transcriptional regulator C-terminal domain-containing protein [Streptomyces erythrochromogenes]|uniref:TetR/AcrR family transcriptional regulator C-terminal domain-containing protein n=1 Tax=Streptomyces erythrochromogenes TaxID=285574 RepID=UPI003390191E